MPTDEIKTNLLNQLSKLREEKRIHLIVNERIELKEDEEVQNSELSSLPHLIFYDKKRFVIEEPRH